MPEYSKGLLYIRLGDQEFYRLRGPYECHVYTWPDVIGHAFKYVHEVTVKVCTGMHLFQLGVYYPAVLLSRWGSLRCERIPIMVYTTSGEYNTTCGWTFDVRGVAHT